MAGDSLFYLYLLGRFRLEDNGREIRLNTRRTEALLAYLALHPEPHTREKLAGLLWGDSPPERANASLRNALNALRRHLGPEALLADRLTVQLDAALPMWVDARQPDDDRDQGELLADFYDDWVLPLREHYRAAYVERLLGATQSFRANSDYAGAIRTAERVLAADAANERAHQHLMFCYLAEGQRDAALAQYDRLRKALQAEFGVEPLPETTALFQWVQRAPPAKRQAAAQRTNLPASMSSFIGRIREIEALRRQISPQGAVPGQPRLITLTGPGGCGKTRLAVEAAAALAEAYEDGVWWVELAGLAEPALVPNAVGRALGVREGPSRATIEALREHLQTRHLLLLLDNCEHLVEACARLAERLLHACPRLVILATSREPLGLTGEALAPVAGLALPAVDAADALAAVAGAEAGRLFVERAQAVRPTFQLTASNGAAVADICRRLDGLPLAIELAAARSNVLSAEQIADRLADRLALLTTGSRTALPRHQTLRAALDWSYDLLAESEQALLRQLSVFAGRFALEAVEAIEGPNVNVLDGLSQLVSKSLVMVETEHNGALRYRLLETVRAFAYGLLADAGETADTHDRHLSYFTALAKRAAADLQTGQHSASLLLLEQAHDNLLAALDYAEHEPGRVEAGLSLAATLWRFWWSRGQYRLGHARLESVLARPAAAAHTLGRAEALLGLGALRHVSGEYQAAEQVLVEALDLFRELGVAFGQAGALNILGLVAHERGDNEAAMKQLEASLELSRQATDPRIEANVLNNLGHVAMEQGDWPLAEGYLELSAAAWRAQGNDQGLAYCLFNLGEIARRQGRYAEAMRWHEQALGIRRRLGDRPRIGWSLYGLGQTGYDAGDLGRAADNLDEAVALFRQVGDRPGLAEALLCSGKVRLRQETVERASAHFAESLRLYHALGREAGAAEALAGLGAVAAAQDQAERAAQLLGAAEAWLARLGMQTPPADALVSRQAAGLARNGLRPDVFESAWEAGRALAAKGGQATVDWVTDIFG